MDTTYRRREVIAAIQHPAAFEDTALEEDHDSNIALDLPTWLLFDAAPWFLRASDDDIIKLRRADYRGNAAMAIARWCWAWDDSPDWDELPTAAPVGHPGQEALVEPISLTLWLLEHRTLLAITEFKESVHHIRKLVQEIRAGVLHSSRHPARCSHRPHFDATIQVEVGDIRVPVMEHYLAVRLVEMADDL